MKKNDDVVEQGFNETASNFNNSNEVIVVIRCYEEIIKTKNKKALEYTGKQGELLNGWIRWKRIIML